MLQNEYLQWLKNDFLKYLNEWEEGVMKREKFTVTQKYRMLISQETLLGIRMTGKMYHPLNC